MTTNRAGHCGRESPGRGCSGSPFRSDTAGRGYCRSNWPLPSRSWAATPSRDRWRRRWRRPRSWNVSARMQKPGNGCRGSPRVGPSSACAPGRARTPWRRMPPNRPRTPWTPTPLSGPRTPWTPTPPMPSSSYGATRCPVRTPTARSSPPSTRPGVWPARSTARCWRGAARWPRPPHTPSRSHGCSPPPSPSASVAPCWRRRCPTSGSAPTRFAHRLVPSGQTPAGGHPHRTGIRPAAGPCGGPGTGDRLPLCGPGGGGSKGRGRRGRVHRRTHSTPTPRRYRLHGGARPLPLDTQGPPLARRLGHPGRLPRPRPHGVRRGRGRGPSRWAAMARPQFAARRTPLARLLP